MEQNPENEQTIDLIGDRKSGAEHHVWLDPDQGLARKIPNWLGNLWQKMDKDHAERDLGVLREHGVPMVPTEVRPETSVRIAGRVRKNVGYVLEQPFYEHSHPLTVRDLYLFPMYRREFLEMVRRGKAIRAKKGLGLDLLGGKVVNLLRPALNPLERFMRAEIANLLVADQDIRTSKEWPSFQVPAGGVVARKGEIQQCDVRLYDFKRGNGFKETALRSVLLNLQDAQDTVLWTLLDELGYRKEFDTEATHFRRMVRAIMEQAIPKMRAYAQLVGLKN